MRLRDVEPIQVQIRQGGGLIVGNRTIRPNNDEVTEWREERSGSQSQQQPVSLNQQQQYQKQEQVDKPLDRQPLKSSDALLYLLGLT